MQLSDLIAEETTESVEIRIYVLCDSLGLPTTSWADDGAIAILIRAIATIYAVVYNTLILSAIRGGFLDYALGGWLTLLARNCFNTERNPATFATGLITFFNSSPGNYVINAGDTLTVRNPATNATYKADGPLVIPASGSIVGVPIRADAPGTGSNSAATTISILVDSLPGVTCSNPAAVLGQDEELDEALRARARLAVAATSPAGAPDAYRYVATTLVFRTDGTRVDVTKVSVLEDEADGSVDVYYGSPTGPTADLARVNEVMELGSLDPDHPCGAVVPAGVDYNGFSAVSVTINITANVFARASSGFSALAIQAAIEADLEAFFPSTANAIGGFVYDPPNPGVLARDELIAIVSQVAPGGSNVRPVLKVDTVTFLPATDTVLTAAQLPTLGVPTITVTLV